MLKACHPSFVFAVVQGRVHVFAFCVLNRMEVYLFWVHGSVSVPEFCHVVVWGQSADSSLQRPAVFVSHSKREAARTKVRSTRLTYFLRAFNCPGTGCAPNAGSYSHLLICLSTSRCACTYHALVATPHL